MPSPLPLSGFLEKDPKSLLGYKPNTQPGSLEKQAFGMAGLKIDPAQSPRSQMYKIAEKFRTQPHAAGGAPSAYADLRCALDNNHLEAAGEEVQRLKASGHAPVKIAQALGIRPDGSVKPELFTGSLESKRKMMASLSPDQRKVYFEAQHDRGVNAKRLRQVLARGSKAVLASA